MELISGVMPKWQQVTHRFTIGAMCAFFLGFFLYNNHFLDQLRNPQAQKGALFMTVWIVAVAAIGGISTWWLWRRLVVEFTYDGRALRFRTLGRPQMELRDVSEIVQMKDWRGRGGSMGYKIKFRDGAKIYLQFGTPNVTALGEAIRSTLRS